jgi:RecB family exonuclease
MTELPDFSASRFNLYKTCPRLYMYQYIENMPSSKHIYTVMGSALHKAIEEFYKGKENPMKTYSDCFYNDLDNALHSQAGLVSAELSTKAHKTGADIIRDFNWDRFVPKEIELGFRFPFPTANPMVMMRGFIDMITEEGEIIDHKSSSKKPTKEELANNPQLILYVWAHEQLYGIKPKKVYWHHLRTLELVEANVLENYDEKLKNLELVLERILSDTEFPKIEQGGFCNRVCAHASLCWPREQYGYEESSFTEGSF